jgi:hypothetical protein
MTTRLRPDRDVVIRSGFRTRVPRLDHTVADDDTVAKIGFDATAPYDAPDDIEHRRPRPPRIASSPARKRTVREALEDGPKFFIQIMEGVGSTDGREIATELERLRQQGFVDRGHDGEWRLTEDA